MSDCRSIVTKSGAVVEVPNSDIHWVSRNGPDKLASVTLLVNNQVAARLLEELFERDSENVSD